MPENWGRVKDNSSQDFNRAVNQAISRMRMKGGRLPHPAVVAEALQRRSDFQLRLADRITAFAGSMPFVTLHVLLFTVWMVLLERNPWPLLTLVVSLESIFLTAFVMIGQNRQAAFQQIKAAHDFEAQELELRTNTELTHEVHRLTAELHHRFIGDQQPGPPSSSESPQSHTILSKEDCNEFTDRQ